jgi:hypothetical protein
VRREKRINGSPPEPTRADRPIRKAGDGGLLLHIGGRPKTIGGSKGREAPAYPNQEGIMIDEKIREKIQELIAGTDPLIKEIWVIARDTRPMSECRG